MIVCLGGIFVFCVQGFSLRAMWALDNRYHCGSHRTLWYCFNRRVCHCVICQTLFIDPKERSPLFFFLSWEFEQCRDFISPFLCAFQCQISIVNFPSEKANGRMSAKLPDCAMPPCWCRRMSSSRAIQTSFLMTASAERVWHVPVSVGNIHWSTTIFWTFYSRYLVSPRL